MAKLVSIDPFNRLEGDLRVTATIEDNVVSEARSSGIMFRGFERMMSGRNPMDALVITPRICGICSASHGIASSKALANALNCSMPANGFYMKNLIMAAEVVMSHLSHFYLLFAPDLTNPAYERLEAFAQLKERFTPMSGQSVVQAVKARQSMLEIMGLVAGKWPNTLAMHPSGTTSTLNLSTLTRAVGILNEFRSFIEKNLLCCSIDQWLDIDRHHKLDQWLGNTQTEQSDLGLFLSSCISLEFDKLGKGPERFLSFGGYDMPEGAWLQAGYFDRGTSMPDQELIREHIGASFFRDAMESRHPLEGVTEPCHDREGAYSWVKAPRYQEKTVEVGPLARMVVSSDPLISDIFNRLGANVLTRMTARLQEMVKLVQEMGRWLEAIKPDQPFYTKGASLYAEQGIGLTEAARGSLGHWMTTTSNTIDNYQVITPSAWNMSPRDGSGAPGPVEEALQSTYIADPDNPVEINHIIRSFDPCMSCSVH